MDGKFTVIAAVIVLVITSMQSQQNEAQSATPKVSFPAGRTAKFVASPEKKFGDLIGEAMDVMHRAMQKGPYNGEVDHDFVTMMIPHQQGAIDMAKSLLLYGKDPQTRRLAQDIISERQSEIQLMQLWLKDHDETSHSPTQMPD